MSSSSLYRLCGIALIIGGILAILTAILSIFIVPPPIANGTEGPPPAVITNIETLQWIFFAFATPGWYVKQANRAGWFGFLAFILLFLTFLLSIGVTVAEGIFVPVLPLPAVEPKQILIFVAIRALLGNLTFLITGLAMYRARVFPRGAAILLMLPVLLGLINFLHYPVVVFDLPLVVTTGISTISQIATFVGFLWCGYALLTEQSQTAPQSKLEVDGEMKQVAPKLN